MYPVHFQKCQHNVHTDALVAVHKSVVGDERIAEPCALFLLGGIELLPVRAGKGVLQCGIQQGFIPETDTAACFLGDIICCLDESSSIEGEAAAWGKAVAMTLLEIAAESRRSFVLIHFAGSSSCQVDIFRPGEYTLEDKLTASETFLGGATELAIESLGTYTISGSGSNGADEAFADIADVWFPDGEKDGLSCIVILSDGQWGLEERTQAGEDFVTVDRGQLEQDPDDADQYYARSSAFDDVTYDMHTTAEKDLLWWGGENDTYLRQADSR